MERRFSIYLFRGISYYCHLESCLIELRRFSTSQLQISHFALIVDTPLNIHFLIYLGYTNALLYHMQDRLQPIGPEPSLGCSSINNNTLQVLQRTALN